MAEKELGADFAIHGGGLDLVFPHHENEIAQTEAARGVPLARIWMHNGMVRLAEEKMSKSVGNIFQLCTRRSTRFGARGRRRLPASPATTASRSSSPTSALERGGRPRRADPQLPARAPAATGAEEPFVAERREAFLDALADDFNTPARLRARCSSSSPRATGARCRAPARPLARAARRCSGSRASLRPEGEGADAEAEALLAEREAARGAARLRARRRASRRARRARLRDPRHAPTGARLVPRVAERMASTEIVYGRRPVAEARARAAPGAPRLARQPS